MNSGFVLPNVGPGPDPLTVADLEAEFAVLLLHRDFYCSECRQQIRRVKKRYDEFEARDAEVLSVLPEDRETAAEWQKQYHLPFPVLADADTQLGDRFDQPTRFGLLGKLHDVIGRMPAVIVLDLRWREPVESYAHRGDSRTDRPRIDEVLEALDHAATLDAAAVADAAPDDRAAPLAASDLIVDDTEDTREAPGEPTPVPGADGDESTGDAPAHAVPPESDPPDDPPVDSARSEVEPADIESTDTDPTADAGPADTDPTADAGADLREADRTPKPQRLLTTPDIVDLPENVTLRRGEPDDVVAAMRVLQGALLDVDGSTVRDAAPAGEVLLAEEGTWVVGALVLREGHIEGVAVRRDYRGQGIGSALVEAAVVDEGGTVTADFRAGVRGFWKALGFDVEQEGSRFWGRRTVD
ncbi:MAG: GNAT family N-acetyltransferase [Halolamina sp.]